MPSRDARLGGANFGRTDFGDLNRAAADDRAAASTCA